MRFYRIDAPGAQGQWFATQAEAKAAAKAAGTRFALVEIPDDKSGKLAWLNTFAWGQASAAALPDGHDNLAGVPPVERNAAELAARGIDDPSLPPTESLAAAPTGDGIWLEGPKENIHELVPEEFHGMIEPTKPYAERSIGLDQAFAAAPLGQQLTLAAMALEAARTRVG